MTQRKTDRVETQSAHPLDERLEHLKQLYPEAVTEDGIDFDALRNLLGIEFPQKERYQFTWAGKQEAMLSLQKRSKGTLKPVPEESVNWDSTGHLFIEGDNLEVLKLLYKSYFGRVKTIYIDPPYNTGNDFVYPDDYADALKKYLYMTGQTDENGFIQTTDVDLAGRKHSTWLSMMYPRLFLARQLLREDGMLFISIDDNEYTNLVMLLKQVFGEENYVGSLVIQSNPRGRQLEPHIATAHEYVIVFARNKQVVSVQGAPLSETLLQQYKETDKSGRKYRLLGLRKRGGLARRIDRPNLHYPIYVHPETGEISVESFSGSVEVIPKLSDGTDGVWRWSKTKVVADVSKLEARIVQGRNEWDIFERDYLLVEGEQKTTMYKSLWAEKEMNYEKGKEALKELFNGDSPFDTPKPLGLLRKIITMSSSSDDIVMDLFAGSCTTAQAVLEQNRDDQSNRRFVMVQIPHVRDSNEPNLVDIGKERIRRVIQRMVDERNGKLEGFEQHPDEDLGFRVFKLDSSAMRQWEDMPASTTTPEEYARQLEMFVKDPLLEGWTIDDVIAEVAIKETGFSLSYRVEQVAEVTALTVYRVVDDEKEQFFYICLDDKLSVDALKPLNLQRDDLLIFRDSAVTDTIVANLVLTCRIKSI